MSSDEMNSVVGMSKDDVRRNGSYEQEHDELLVLRGRVEQCRELHSIQGQDGNFNVDGYMCGMFNGMEILLSVLEGRRPVFRTIIPRETNDQPPEELKRLEAEINANEVAKKTRTISGTVHQPWYQQSK